MSDATLREAVFDVAPSPAKRFWAKVKVGPGCWLWLGKRDPKSGYGRVWSEGREQQAHRVAYKLVFGSAALLDADHGLHSCDTPACVHPLHVRPGTPKENAADMLARNRGCGQHGPMLKPAEQQEILDLYATGLSQRTIAKQIGRNQRTVWRVVQRHRMRSA